MRLVDAPTGWTAYTQLAHNALAVVLRRVDGWCMYVGGVPGFDHASEAHWVLDHGDKLDEGTARAICAHRFHPPIEVDGLEYAR